MEDTVLLPLAGQQPLLPMKLLILINSATVD